MLHFCKMDFEPARVKKVTPKFMSVDYTMLKSCTWNIGNMF